MRAVAGDRIAIMSRHLDEPVREGEIVEVHGTGGEPPYVVRWLDTGHTAVLYPGPDAHVVPGGNATAAARVSGPVRSGQWQVTVGVVAYADGKTRSHILAETGFRTVQAHGEAQLLAGDVDVPQVGDEVAVGRAFIALGEELLGQATQDIEDIEGHRTAVRRSPRAMAV